MIAQVCAPVAVFVWVHPVATLTLASAYLNQITPLYLSHVSHFLTCAENCDFTQEAKRGRKRGAGFLTCSVKSLKMKKETESVINMG